MVKNASFTFNISWILPDNFPSIVNQQIKVVGTEGICEIDSQDRGMLSSYSNDKACHIINPFSKYVVYDMTDNVKISEYTCESIIYFTKLLKMIKEGKKLEELKGKYPDDEQAINITRVGIIRSKMPIELVRYEDEEAGNSFGENRSTWL
ncbi:MAG TPA: hypothetical protein GXX37_06620 [Clostridiaceae bacterium]|nr:hypothetical protein [Clostridiaceae bacterium]